eukprot:m.221632 g.221632  ORF g.221632 m.221632 type:complete len:1107 (-) comp15129_c0_seq6:496-3816(-)
MATHPTPIGEGVQQQAKRASPSPSSTIFKRVQSVSRLKACVSRQDAIYAATRPTHNHSSSTLTSSLRPTLPSPSSSPSVQLQPPATPISPSSPFEGVPTHARYPSRSRNTGSTSTPLRRQSNWVAVSSSSTLGKTGAQAHDSSAAPRGRTDDTFRSDQAEAAFECGFSPASASPSISPTSSALFVLGARGARGLKSKTHSRHHMHRAYTDSAMDSSVPGAPRAFSHSQVSVQGSSKHTSKRSSKHGHSCNHSPSEDELLSFELDGQISQCFSSYSTATDGESDHATNYTSPHDSDQPLSRHMARASISQFQEVEQFSIGKRLGEGAFATVRAAEHLVTGEQVAIKTIRLNSIKDEYVRRNLLREVHILRQVHHPHVVKLLQVINTGQLLCIVTEKLESDLLTKVVDDGAVSEAMAQQYTTQLICAVSYLHSINIVHRDIKLENILLDFKNNVRLTDFGLSNQRPDSSTLFDTWCGSLAYSAPELLGKKPYGESVDIWGIGVCLYVMLTASLPFPAQNVTELHACILDKRVRFPETMSITIVMLLERFFEFKPQKRITMPQLLQHPWLDSRVLRAGLHGNRPTEIHHLDGAVISRLEAMGVGSVSDIENAVLEVSLDVKYCSYHLMHARKTRHHQHQQECDVLCPPGQAALRPKRAGHAVRRTSSLAMLLYDGDGSQSAVQVQKPRSSSPLAVSSPVKETGDPLSVIDSISSFILTEPKVVMKSVAASGAALSDQVGSGMGSPKVAGGSVGQSHSRHHLQRSQRHRSVSPRLTRASPTSSVRHQDDSLGHHKRRTADPFMDKLLHILDLIQALKDGQSLEIISSVLRMALRRAPNPELSDVLTAFGWDGVRLQEGVDVAMLASELGELIPQNLRAELSKPSNSKSRQPKRQSVRRQAPTSLSIPGQSVRRAKSWGADLDTCNPSSASPSSPRSPSPRPPGSPFSGFSRGFRNTSNPTAATSLPTSRTTSSQPLHSMYSTGSLRTTKTPKLPTLKSQEAHCLKASRQRSIPATRNSGSAHTPATSQGYRRSTSCPSSNANAAASSQLHLGPARDQEFALAKGQGKGRTRGKEKDSLNDTPSVHTARRQSPQRSTQHMTRTKATRASMQ